MRAGDAVWNPLTGEKALLIESAEETAGAGKEEVRARVRIDPSLDSHPSAKASLGRLPDRVTGGTR
jgi:hypothetical protein